MRGKFIQQHYLYLDHDHITKLLISKKPPQCSLIRGLDTRIIYEPVQNVRNLISLGDFSGTMLSPAAPGQAYRRISSSCHAATNRVRAFAPRSNFKNGGDNIHCILFVTGRYFDFLSILVLLFSRHLSRVFRSRVLMISHILCHVLKLENFNASA